MTSSKAVCVLNGDAQGVINFASAGGKTHVTGTISGLSPGLHGFHIHVYGDTTNGCASCGGHYNPHNKTHAGPTDANRHAGDLGNILADAKGIAKIDISDSQIPINQIVGRAVVVHAGEDDLGRGGNDESLKTGNAGGRVTCGVIAIAPEPAKM